jgi:hypothetical protein
MTDSPRKGPSFPCCICGATHLYDCPNLGPVSFLRAVQSDTTVPLLTRMKAADHLLRLRAKGICSDPIEPEPELTIVIPDIKLPDIKLHS